MLAAGKIGVSPTVQGLPGARIMMGRRAPSLRLRLGFLVVGVVAAMTGHPQSYRAAAEQMRVRGIGVAEEK
jgi:hypothetical protein